VALNLANCCDRRQCGNEFTESILRHTAHNALHSKHKFLNTVLPYIIYNRMLTRRNSAILLRRRHQSEGIRSEKLRPQCDSVKWHWLYSQWSGLGSGAPAYCI